MDLRRGEESKIPLLEKLCSFEVKDRIEYYCAYFGIAVLAVGFYAMVTWAMLTASYSDDHPLQPELQLNSILVCPTIRDSVIWDLKFDLINTYNNTDVCVFGFEVYLFLYNQTNLLAKAYAHPVSPYEYIVPGNRASIIGFAEEGFTSIQDLMNEDNPSNGTIRLDLKLHNRVYDLVCGDVKVSLSSNSSSSSCGSMVGDPLACSYQPHSSHRLVTLLLLIFILLMIIAFLGSSFRACN